MPGMKKVLEKYLLNKWINICLHGRQISLLLNHRRKNRTTAPLFKKNFFFFCITLNTILFPKITMFLLTVYFLKSKNEKFSCQFSQISWCLVLNTETKIVFFITLNVLKMLNKSMYHIQVQENFMFNCYLL